MNPRDMEIFSKGQPVLLADARSAVMEDWVQSIAKAANARVDWHYSGGIAQMLHLGDDESRARVEAAVDELTPEIDPDEDWPLWSRRSGLDLCLTQTETNPRVRIMRRFRVGDVGAARAGVNFWPEQAVGGFNL